MRRPYRAVTVLAVAAATLTTAAATSAATASAATAAGQAGKVTQAGQVTLYSARVLSGPRAIAARSSSSHRASIGAASSRTFIWNWAAAQCRPCANRRARSGKSVLQP